MKYYVLFKGGALPCGKLLDNLGVGTRRRFLLTFGAVVSIYFTI